MIKIISWDQVEHSKQTGLLFEALKAQAVPSLWQHTQAEPDVIRASIFLKGRERREEKAKQYGGRV